MYLTNWSTAGGSVWGILGGVVLGRVSLTGGSNFSKQTLPASYCVQYLSSQLTTPALGMPLGLSPGLSEHLWNYKSKKTSIFYKLLWS